MLKYNQSVINKGVFGVQDLAPTSGEELGHDIDQKNKM